MNMSKFSPSFKVPHTYLPWILPGCPALFSLALISTPEYWKFFYTTCCFLPL
jgi:hypothetical protein